MAAKPFSMGGEKVIIAQVNTVDIDKLYKKKAELEEAINQKIDEQDLGFFLFVATDILNSNSDVLALGTDRDKEKRAFGVELDDKRAVLKGVFSRKKYLLTT